MYFDKSYNRQEFLTIFQTKICPNFVRQERPLQVNRKTAYFVDNKVYRLWTVELDQEISVLEIQQKSSKDPRITLTKDAFKILDDNGIDNALVIFYSPDNTSYRLSLLTTKYVDWDKKTTSSYKRYSYILWPGEKTKTPEKQLLHPIKDYNDFVSRFDVEVVRKDFFEKYLELYVRLYKEIRQDKEFENLLKSQNVDLVSFTKNLLGKIVFLYFIQQKGRLWLGKKETEYGKWNKNFMRVMRDNFNKDESMSTEKTWFFYNDYLERLFFAGLNIDRRDQDDRFPSLKMKVPYLNWWLFKEDYQWRESYIAKISNDIFSNVDTKWDEADGILDIFDRYNFTVDEDSLYDSDIAVDPEMLGRIFEKMISISSENIDEVVELYDNKGKKAKIDFGKELNKKLGAFYTPREIVHYMTKESLIAYLVNNIKWDKEQNEKLIRDLFELKEQFLLSKEDLTKTNFSSDIFDKLWWIIEQIDDALKKVKILDPAVWSWAFPMGLLHEISNIRYYIYGVFYKTFGVNIDEYKNDKKLSLYKIKREIILNNIYGVDIDPGAIDIARLRFWLSLIVDEEQPEPLPNFEFKFVCANTLIPLEEETKEKDLFAQWDEPKLETLKKYKKEYYNASGNKEKQQLKERIREYTKVDTTLFSEPTPRARQMAEFGANFDNTKHSHSFFDPSLMMSEWRGFDIIIGNPPYVNAKKMSSLDRQRMSAIYKLLKWSWDLYIVFLIKAYNLMNKNWIFSWIIPNKLLIQDYAREVLSFMKINWLHSIINVSHLDVFKDVWVYPIVVLWNKIWTKHFQEFILSSINDLSEIKKFVKKENSFKRFSVIKDFNNIKIFSWLTWFEATKVKPLITEMENRSNNSVRFVVSWTIDPYIILNKSVPYMWLKFNNPYFNYDPNIISEWKWKFFNKDKIIIAWMTKRIESVYSKDPIWLGVWCYAIYEFGNFEPKFLLWILNSKFLTFYLNVEFREKHLAWWYLAINKSTIEQLPLIKTIKEEQTPFIERVDQILAITNQLWYDPKNPPQEQLDLEKEIDQMVYELYGLSDEEVRVVEESVR